MERIDRAKANIEYLAENNLTVEHRIVDLSGVMGIFNSALTNKDIEVPEGHYEEAQMKATVVPHRNAIFSSILCGYGLSIATQEDTDVSIALGVHSGDHTICLIVDPNFINRLESFAMRTGIVNDFIPSALH